MFWALGIWGVQFSRHIFQCPFGAYWEPNLKQSYFWASWIFSLLLIGKSLFSALSLLDFPNTFLNNALSEHMTINVPTSDTWPFRFRESINIVINIKWFWILFNVHLENWRSLDIARSFVLWSFRSRAESVSEWYMAFYIVDLNIMWTLSKYNNMFY